MSIFDSTTGRGRVIDTGGGNLLRLAGLAVLAFVLVILFFSSVTRVNTGHVGVLTLFGKVTGETLSEGIHLINPLKNQQRDVDPDTNHQRVSHRSFQ